MAKNKEKENKLTAVDKALMTVIRPAKILSWGVLTLLCVMLPNYFAQVYESSIYSMGTMEKTQAAHYANMIQFGYSVASLATVLIAYLMIKRLWKLVKEKSPLEKYYDMHPDQKPVPFYKKLFNKKKHKK